MNAIIKERQLTPSQEDELSLKEIAPEKFEPQFDPDLQFKLTGSKKSAEFRSYSCEEVALLFSAASGNLHARSPLYKESSSYPTMTREHTQWLLDEQRRYKEFEKKAREERASWESQKMTVSETRTGSIKKPSTSTKG